MRANPEDARQRAIYASVANFSPDSQQTDLELLLDDRLLETRPLTIPAGGDLAPGVPGPSNPRDGVFTVRLTTRTTWPWTTRPRIVSLLPKPVKVLLVSRGNRLLEKALRAVPNVELAAATDLTDAAAGFDFVVLDVVTPTRLAERQRARDSCGEHQLAGRGAERGGAGDRGLEVRPSAAALHRL